MNKPCASLLVAVLLLLWPALGHAHDQSRAFATLTAKPDGALALKLEMSEADLLQILTELPTQGALPPTEVTDAAAQARLKDAFPTWFTLAGDGEPCPLRFDEAELAESLELPGADLSDESLSVRVLPRQSDEFTCVSCFLVQHRSQLDHEGKSGPVCRECA